MAVSDQIIPALQGETIDALVWRVLGKSSGAVEVVLEANRGLADLGAILPEGTVVLIPGVADATAEEVAMVQLWT